MVAPEDEESGLQELPNKLEHGVEEAHQQLQSDVHFWEWANEWADAKSYGPNSAARDATISKPRTTTPAGGFRANIAGIAEPLPRPPSTSKEKPPETTNATQMQVSADPHFWEWAREWTQLHVSSSAPDPAADFPVDPRATRNEERNEERRFAVGHDPNASIDDALPRLPGLPAPLDLQAIADSENAAGQLLGLPPLPDLPGPPSLALAIATTPAATPPALGPTSPSAVGPGPSAWGPTSPAAFQSLSLPALPPLESLNENAPDDFSRPPPLSSYFQS